MDEFGEFGKDVAKLHVADSRPNQLKGYVRFECDLYDSCQLIFMVDMYGIYGERRDGKGPFTSIDEDGWLYCECPRCGEPSMAQMPDSWEEPLSTDTTCAKYTCDCEKRLAIFCDHGNQQRVFDENGSPDVDSWFCDEKLTKQKKERI